ncbi:hypothetical protein D3C72_2379250 [compost metagenome]
MPLSMRPNQPLVPKPMCGTTGQLSGRIEPEARMALRPVSTYGPPWAKGTM